MGSDRTLELIQALLREEGEGSSNLDISGEDADGDVAVSWSGSVTLPWSVVRPLLDAYLDGGRADVMLPPPEGADLPELPTVSRETAEELVAFGERYAAWLRLDYAHAEKHGHQITEEQLSRLAGFEFVADLFRHVIRKQHEPD